MISTAPTITPQRALAARAARHRGAAAVFAAAMLIYLVFFGGHYVTWDHAERIAWAKSMIDHRFGYGSTDISAYFSDAVHCKYGIGQSLLHVPLILLSRGIFRLTHIACEGPINMMLYVVNGAAGIALIYLLLSRRLGVASGAAARRAIAIGVCTAWFAYTKVEYGEALVATAMLAVWYCGFERPLLAGIFAGAAVTIRPEAFVWVFITIVVMPARDFQTTSAERPRWGLLKHPPALAWFAAGLVPAVVLVMWSNIWRTGNPLSAGYEAGFVYPWAAGIYGLLFSAGKSVFLFSPLLLLLFPAAWQAINAPRARRNSPDHRAASPEAKWIVERCATAIWAAVLLGAQILFYGKWWDWAGDDSWGPRFLIPGVMAAMLVVAAWPIVSWRWKLSWALLAVVGLAVQFPAVLFGPHESIMLTTLRKPMKIADSSGLRTPITQDDQRFNPRYSQVAESFELLEIKLLRRFPRAPMSRYIGTTWAESFDPPLKASDIPYDIFWLNPRHHAGGHPVAPTAGQRAGK